MRCTDTAEQLKRKIGIPMYRSQVVKRALILIFPMLVMACTNTPSSYYESGWNNDVSEQAFRGCGRVWISKDVFDPSHLERLILAEKLSKSQAARVMKGQVLRGDSECLAYAAYGMKL